MSVNEDLNQPLKLGPVNGHLVFKTLALANSEGSNIAQLNVLSSFTVSILLSFVEYTFVLLPVQINKYINKILNSTFGRCQDNLCRLK